jgi:hypothetical protein
MAKRKKQSSKVRKKTTAHPKKVAQRKAATKQLEQKFRQLAGLRSQCPDVTRIVVRTPQNVQHKDAFDKTRKEIVEAIGEDQYERRFEPYLLRELVRDAIRIIEAHDPKSEEAKKTKSDWLEEAKKTLDDHHRAAGN